MKRRLGIIVQYGFHEVKKYIYSGLAVKLLERFDIHFLILEKDRKAIESEFDNYGELHFVQESIIATKATRYEILARASAEAWMRNNRIPLFHNYRTRAKKKKWDAILGHSLTKRFLIDRATKQVERIYNNDQIASILKSNALTHILGTSVTSTFAVSVFVTANHLRLNTYYLVNSWKDLYVNPLVPFDGFKKMFVWNDQMKGDYLRICSYLQTNKVFITGNPSFDPYIDYQPRCSKSYYAKKYGLDEEKLWLYYTMMPPGIWNDEIGHVLELGRRLKQEQRNIEILIRRNPNHHKKDFTDLDLPSNCTLTEHYITYDQKKDLIVQTEEGEFEWMDLVFYTDANMSIPSTVTLEFMALGKPVLNPIFSMSGAFPQGLGQHFESGFYKPLFRENHLVLKSTTVEKLIEQLGLIQSGKGNSEISISATDLILNQIE